MTAHARVTRVSSSGILILGLALLTVVGSAEDPIHGIRTSPALQSNYWEELAVSNSEYKTGSYRDIRDRFGEHAFHKRRSSQAIASQIATSSQEPIVQIVSFVLNQQGEYVTHLPGSGVIVHPSGLILTNSHAIRRLQPSDSGCGFPADRLLASLLVILIQDRPKEPPRPQYAVDLRGLTEDALTHALPAEDPSLDLAVVRINKRFTNEELKNFNDVIQAVQNGRSLPLADLTESPKLETLSLWDSAALEEGQDVQVVGYPAVSPLPRLTFTEGPILEKRTEGTLLVDRAFATLGSSGGALVDKKYGFVVGILCGGEPIETPAGQLYLTVGRALDTQTQSQQFWSKVPEVQRRPVPRFTFTPEFPRPGEIMTLDASASFDPDGTIANYRWDFDGDGKTDAEGAQIHRVFQDDARVTLLVTDGDGLPAQRSQRVILDRRQQIQCGRVEIVGKGTYTTIREAIDKGIPGDTITVGPGTCQENLAITKSLTLKGSGRGQTILLGDGRDPVIAVCPRKEDGESVCSRPIEVIIEGFTVRNGLHALQAFGQSAKGTLRDCDLLESVQQGVDAAFGADITLINNDISHNDEEGFVLEGGRVELWGNTIAENGDKGVLVKSLRTHEKPQPHVIHADALLVENTIDSNTAFGAFVTQSASLKIQGGQISRSGSNGLKADEQADVTLLGAKLSANNGAEVNLLNAVAVIQQETVVSNGSRGIQAQGNAQLNLSNSEVSGSDISIVIEDSAQAVITKAKISGYYDGIVMLDSANVTISESTFTGLSDDLDIDHFAQATVSSSTFSARIHVDRSAQLTISNSQVDGAGISLGTSAKATIFSVTIANSSWCGIEVRELAQATVSNSTITHNTMGICVDLGTPKLELYNSVLNDNKSTYGGTAIFMGDSAQATIQNNQISGNYGDGIFISGSAQAMITDNAIQDNRKCGIWAWPSPVPRVRAYGGNNRMSANGTDLCGNISNDLRIRLASQTDQTVLSFPGAYRVLQEAVDAIAPGGTITLAAGEYIAGLTIWKPLTLRGAGREQTRLKGAISLISGAQEVSIDKLNIMGSEFDGLLIGSTASATITNSQISDNKDAGIYIGGSAETKIQNTRISRNAWVGLLMANSTQATVYDSQISANWVGITLWGSAWITISNTQIYENNGSGIEMSDWAEATIQWNKIFDNRGYGVALSQRPCWNTDSQFTGVVRGHSNQIYNNSKGDLCPRPGQYPWPAGFGGGA